MKYNIGEIHYTSKVKNETKLLFAQIRELGIAATLRMWCR